MAQGKAFNRQTLERALHELGRRAHAEGKTVEIAIHGGSALMLTYDWRLATKAVDAVFESDRTTVRRLARHIAEEYDWDPNWLNDGVKGFESLKARLTVESPAAFRRRMLFVSKNALFRPRASRDAAAGE